MAWLGALQITLCSISFYSMEDPFFLVPDFIIASDDFITSIKTSRLKTWVNLSASLV